MPAQYFAFLSPSQVFFSLFIRQRLAILLRGYCRPGNIAGVDRGCRADFEITDRRDHRDRDDRPPQFR
jgi:hypothetical protein